MEKSKKYDSSGSAGAIKNLIHAEVVNKEKRLNSLSQKMKEILRYQNEMIIHIEKRGTKVAFLPVGIGKAK